MFLLNDFRKKVNENLSKQKGKKPLYVTAFKASLQQQVDDKKKQDAIRDQYEKAIVPRFAPVEHTEGGLTKNLLGQNAAAEVDEDPPAQGEIGFSRIDQIDPWEDSAGGGLEKYNPCVTSVFAPVQYQGLKDTHPQWQREPGSHLSLDFIYGYQGSSCWDQALFGEGPGADNLFFLQAFSASAGKMVNTGEIVYFTAATCVVFDVKNGIQRFFHHSDDVTALTVLRRTHQKADGSWEEMVRPKGQAATEQWQKWFAYNAGVYEPNEKDWTPGSRLLPQSSEEFPQFDEGMPMDWRNWDIPNRCIVASGQKGRNPRIYVWRAIRGDGQTGLEKQVLATMTLGPKKLQVGQLSFNGRGNFLIAVATDMEHSLTVFDWRRGTKIREGIAHGGPVDAARFNPYSDAAFATCGEKHLKYWELGDEDLQMSPGLFGDDGQPLNQRNVAFTPRQNTITGVENGDIYIWSGGKVTARIEKAHKENVLGLLYVDKVGLFTAGKGGHLKLWDPDLRDTQRPIFDIDLRSFSVEGAPKLNARVSGRSMDWTTSEDMLKFVCDDNLVQDDPSRGVCGAPATHMSLRDLGATGMLLLGTTDNAVIFLGFRAVGDKAGGKGDWTRGLKDLEMVHGDSGNTEQGALKEQQWWNHPEVQKVKGTCGAANGQLPVACYWYQQFDETKPGYRAMQGGTAGACPWKWAVCGKRVAMRGHMSHVDGVAPMANERLFMSVSKDCTARIYDVNDQIMIDCVCVHKPARSAVWWSKETQEGVEGDELVNNKKVGVFAVGYEDGSFSVYATEKSAADAADADDVDGTDKDPFHNPENAFGDIRLCCSNPLPRKAPPPAAGRQPSEQAFTVKYSPDGEYFAIALGDNCIDIYRHKMVNFSERPDRELQREQAKQKALGFTDEEIERQTTFPYKRVGCCNDHSSAVTHLDFDVEGKYLRSTSQSNELLYAMLPHGKQSTSTQELSTRKFQTDTCILGWTVKSIWGKGSLGSSVNSLDRSKNKVPPWAPAHGGADPAPYPYPYDYRPPGSTEVQDMYQTKNYPGEGNPHSWGNYVVATGDDEGKVKLFRWPAFGFKQAFRQYVGHGSQVSQVRFSYDDDYLFSAGGSDQSLFQWRHVIPNKIYIQNLPDKKDANTGSYTLSRWELREMLEKYFSAMLRTDEEAEEKVERDRDFTETVAACMGSSGKVSDAQRKTLKRLCRKHKASWDGEVGPSRCPDRPVVSVAIYNSGAANKGVYFPSQEHGCKITDRWAAVTFRSKDDVDDVLDMYGGQQVVKFLNFFKKGLLHLHPLYEQHDDPVPPEDAPKPYDLTKPHELVRETSEKDRKGNRILKKWVPLDDSHYAESNAGRPHFLYVTASDPNESPVNDVYTEAMKSVVEDLRKEGKFERDALSFENVRSIWEAQDKEWDLIQEWMISDDEYGRTSKSGDFYDFRQWKQQLDPSAKRAHGK